MRDTPWYMDAPHLEIMARIVKGIPENGVISEIGSHQGISTQVFIDILKEREDVSLRIIETKPLPELIERIEKSGVEDRIRIDDAPSNLSLTKSDFVLIDGDHGTWAFADLAAALILDCNVIAMHDTATHRTTTTKGCHGAWQAWNLLRKCQWRECVEYCEPMEGYYTHRGLGISWKKGTAWIKC
jgi:hypothetical protein